MITLRQLRLKHRDDRGMALVMVIAIGAVLALLSVSAIAIGVNGIKGARSDESWSGALAAAYAGVEEYQSRLSEDPSYLKYGNPASPFSAGSDLALPPITNNAFGSGTTGTWATVSGSDATASYRYEVNSSEYSTTGSLTLRSTGRVGDTTRTIVADLKQEGFIDFLYFTDFEIQDPAQSGRPAATCAKYGWAGRPFSSDPNSSSFCSDIAFGASDVLNGPVHSNDIIRACSAVFEGPVTTAYRPPAGGLHYKRQNSAGQNCTAPTFVLANYPRYSPIIGMPATNSQLKRETRSDLSTEVPRPGCLYTGPTDIRFNSNGTITVRSPWTKKTRTSGDPATSGSTPSACGTVGSSGLGSSAGATFTLPDNNVIYVQNVPSVSSDPNYWATNAFPNYAGSALTCRGASNQSNGNGIGYPMSNEVAPSNSSYECRKGDLFVKGQVNGSVTLAAEKYVYIIGDLTYVDAQGDMLGIVGNDAIFVWNPMNSSNVKLLSGTNRVVDGALLSVAHTFQVQNYSVGGDRGTLTIRGAIAQKFRGIVRGNGNGYAKDYVYDARFLYMAPPKFLSPVTTTYGVSVWIEVGSAFDSKGALQ